MSERFDDLKTLYEAYLSSDPVRSASSALSSSDSAVKVELLKKLLDRLGAHADAEIVFVFFVIFFIFVSRLKAVSFQGVYRPDR